MSNPYVEEDIRTYVTAKIKGHPKFQRWPLSLQTEVQEALAVGAKGMFRWAVCQLDTLRRLHHQSKIREAIQNLPETLDETYERILSCIQGEERDLVRHTLHLIRFRDIWDYREQPLTATLILDSYSAFRTSRRGNVPDDSLYDLETLKDVCGCLVSFVQGLSRQVETLEVAHYTVLEYIESRRASENADWVKVHPQGGYINIQDSALKFALSTTPEGIEMMLSEDHYDDRLLDLFRYCFRMSFRALFDCPKLVDRRLAFQLADPLGPLRDFHLAKGDWSAWVWKVGILDELPFLGVTWAETFNFSQAATFVNLILLQSYSVAAGYVLHQNVSPTQLLLQGVLEGDVHVEGNANDHWDYMYYRVKGNLLEVLGQLGCMVHEVLDILEPIPEADRLIGYHSILPHFVNNHHWWMDERRGGRVLGVLKRLLGLGASPDPDGFRVTPLQVACYIRSAPDVSLLLEAGADPQGVGDSRGLAWEEGSIMFRYNKLHGVAPIDILDAFCLNIPISGWVQVGDRGDQGYVERSSSGFENITIFLFG